MMNALLLWVILLVVHIERSPSLSTPIWTSIATNSGTGTIMEFHDTAGGGARFYRVSVQ